MFKNHLSKLKDFELKNIVNWSFSLFLIMLITTINQLLMILNGIEDIKEVIDFVNLSIKNEYKFKVYILFVFLFGTLVSLFSWKLYNKELNIRENKNKLNF